jgi:two-component system copper resistance phosphate regulon response regulator CusR
MHDRGVSMRALRPVCMFVGGMRVEDGQNQQSGEEKEKNPPARGQCITSQHSASILLPQLNRKKNLRLLSVRILTKISETLQEKHLALDALTLENTAVLMRILVIEDETKVARALKEGLEGDHYEVVVASTGEEGFFHANAEVFDLIVLDLMLPGRDGIEVLSTLRKRELQTPVLILTAKDAVEDRVLGLDSGADDYLIKPFAFPELLARIRALLRRGRTDQVLRLKVSDLEMDLVTRKVTRNARLLDLTAREFELLEYLLRHHNRLVSREMLAREVWKEPARATPLDNVIDVHIARLRKKVDQDFPVKLIHTMRGIGFVLREDEP